MNNKKILIEALKNINKAKKPVKKKDIIYDNKGQWKFPGLPTRIPSNEITMQGVPYPVLGKGSDDSEQMMYPGAEYTFPGATYVDEYPQMKKGGSKKFSSNLQATNRLFKKNPLFKKKNYKSKTYDPSSMYFEEGGSLLTKKVTCKKCGWKWDAEDGGNDITTCHKCGGQGLIHAQDGINTDAMNGMMKARLAYANEFGNPAAKRMINIPDNLYQFDNGDTGTHYMASYDNYAVPQIQDENGVLQLGDYGPESNEAIRFDSDEDANYFAENYKDVSPGFLNQKQYGGLHKFVEGGEPPCGPDETIDPQTGLCIKTLYFPEVITHSNPKTRKLQGNLMEQYSQVRNAFNSARKNNSENSNNTNYSLGLGESTDIKKLPGFIKKYQNALELEKIQAARNKNTLSDLQKYDPETWKNKKAINARSAEGLASLRRAVKSGAMSQEDFLYAYNDWGKDFDQNAVQGKGPGAVYNNKDADEIWGDDMNKEFFKPLAYGITGALGVIGGGIAAPGIFTALSNPYVSGALTAYGITEGTKEFLNPDSHTRKSLSRAWDDPTASNIGNAVWDTSINALNYVGVPFSKAFQGSKNVIKAFNSAEYASGFNKIKPVLNKFSQNKILLDPSLVKTAGKLPESLVIRRIEEFTKPLKKIKQKYTTDTGGINLVEDVAIKSDVKTTSGLRKALKEDLYRINKLEKENPGIDINNSSLQGHNFEKDNIGKIPEFLKGIEQNKISIEAFGKRFAEQHADKMALINKSDPVFQNIAEQSPQYIDEIVAHIENPLKSDENFLNDLVIQSNTFTRFQNTNKVTDRLIGRSMGRRGSTMDVEGITPSDYYGSQGFRVQPTVDRAQEIFQTPLAQKWSKRIPEFKSDVVLHSDGMHKSYHPDYIDFINKRRTRLDSKMGSQYGYLDAGEKLDNTRLHGFSDFETFGEGKSLQQQLNLSIPNNITESKYFYQPRHLVFESPTHGASLENFDVFHTGELKGLNDYQKFFEGTSKGFKDGGENNNYIEAYLDKKEIEEYRKGGYIVEELNDYAGGGSPIWPPGRGKNKTYLTYSPFYGNSLTGQSSNMGYADNPFSDEKSDFFKVNTIRMPQSYIGVSGGADPYGKFNHNDGIMKKLGYDAYVGLPYNYDPNNTNYYSNTPSFGGRIRYNNTIDNRMLGIPWNKVFVEASGDYSQSDGLNANFSFGTRFDGKKGKTKGYFEPHIGASGSFGPHGIKPGAYSANALAEYQAIMGSNDIPDLEGDSVNMSDPMIQNLIADIYNENIENPLAKGKKQQGAVADIDLGFKTGFEWTPKFLTKRLPGSKIFGDLRYTAQPMRGNFVSGMSEDSQSSVGNYNGVQTSLSDQSETNKLAFSHQFTGGLGLKVPLGTVKNKIQSIDLIKTRIPKDCMCPDGTKVDLLEDGTCPCDDHQIEECPPCPDGSVPRRLKDGTCPCKKIESYPDPGEYARHPRWLKDGGVSYELGDEVDELTMEKLKKQGYTFEIIK